MAKICCVVVFIMLAGCESASKVDTKDFLQSLDSLEAQNTIYSESIIGKQDEALVDLAAIKSQVAGLNHAVQETRRVVETKQVGDMPAYTEAVVVEASEPVSGKEVILQSASTSSLDTVADDGVHFDLWTATWCGPCRIGRPNVEQVARELGIRVDPWDWDEYKRYAADSKVDRLPTLGIVRRGKSRKRLVGPQSVEAIRAAVAEVQAMNESQLVASSDDLTIRNKLPVVATKWGLQDLEEVNQDGTCQCERCVALRALRSEYLAKPEYQNIGRKVEPETF